MNDIAVLPYRPNNCFQQNLQSFDRPFFPQVCFHERATTTVKLFAVFNVLFEIQLDLQNSLLGKTRL